MPAKMPSNASIVAFLVVITAAVFWQWYLYDMLIVTLGVGRVMQPLSDFPYHCRRLAHPLLGSCEDMWLDDEQRILYAACAGLSNRLHWNPGSDVHNSMGRTSTSTITMLDIDDPGVDGFFHAHAMETVGYTGARGGADRTLDLHGFDAEFLDTGKLRFWLINHRPPINEKGELLDARTIGQNSTIEVFEAQRGQTELQHIRTIKDPAVFNPNKVAADGRGGFVSSNDRSGPPSLRRKLDHLLGGGNIAYCRSVVGSSMKPQCTIAASANFSMPNGLIRGHDGLYYVPSSDSDFHKVMQLHPNGTMSTVAFLNIRMPVDNFAVDSNGDLWAAAFPKALKLVASIKDPNVASPSTIFRIRRRGGWLQYVNGDSLEYDVEKILEDHVGAILTGVTVARYDARTERIFLGGVMTDFIAVCDPIRRQ